MNGENLSITDNNEKMLADQQVATSRGGTASSRSSGRADNESPTSRPRGDLAKRRLEAQENGYINMCQPELSYCKCHFHGRT